MTDKYITDEQFISMVRKEAIKARSKFPSSNMAMVALTEEAGELAQALMDKPYDDVIKEAVQVAFMAMRIATEGDPSCTQFRDAKWGRYHPGLSTPTEPKRECGTCQNRCMDMDMDPYCGAVNSPFGRSLSGPILECGPERKLWVQDTRRSRL